MTGAALLFAGAQSASELRFCIRTDPRTFDPLLAAEEASEAVRYLTGGVLIRFNRGTQQFDPELAVSWAIKDQARRIDFDLRQGVRFSDGTPFGPSDVIATFRRIADPSIASGIADAFRSGGRKVTAQTNGPHGVSVLFSSPVAGVEFLFDQLAISPERATPGARLVLGPLMVTEHKSGQYVLLQRNPYYWKTDSSAHRLPYLDSVRLEVQSNREIELVKFRRGELHFIDRLEPETFGRLRKDLPSAVMNLGASLDAEFFWFNQAPNAPVPAYKIRWFQDSGFRRAMSAAVNRDDIIRLVYDGHAHPAVGPVSETNERWFNSALEPQRYDPKLALRLLGEAGFKFDGSALRDREGNVVEFSMITNAGSKTRARIGTMLQQDLKKIGVRLNFTPLEFQSLIERITRTQEYEACLLGLTNVEVDPNSQANVWSSSGTHHAWNPGEAKPATTWEAEIDRLMKVQATALSDRERKQAFDRVQEIVAEQVPIVYLVHPDVLVAISPSVRGAAPSVLPPHLFWNVEHLSLAEQRRQ
jgi:peptide/nickel transport system substrate-binding protein